MCASFRLSRVCWRLWSPLLSGASFVLSVCAACPWAPYLLVFRSQKTAGRVLIGPLVQTSPLLAVYIFVPACSYWLKPGVYVQRCSAEERSVEEGAASSSFLTRLHLALCTTMSLLQRCHRQCPGYTNACCFWIL